MAQDVRTQTLEARIAASRVPADHRGRAVLALRAAGLSCINGEREEAIAGAVLGDLLVRISRERSQDDHVLGGPLLAPPPVVRTASAGVAPRCARCGSPMRAGVKIAGDHPVYYCPVDRFVQFES